MASMSVVVMEFGVLREATIVQGAFAIPSGAKEAKGMVFKVTLANGKTFTGRFANKLGQGWTPVDGYGVVNAEAAVLGH